MHAFAPHVHDAYSLGAIEAGVERFRYKGSEHLAAVGTLVMLNPDELHTGQAEVHADWTYQMLYIAPQNLRSLTGTEAYFPAATTHDPQLATAFKHIFRQMGDAPDELVFVSHFVGLIDTIVAHYGRNAQITSAVSLEKMLRIAAMRRVIDCIEANLASPLPIATLAAESGLSPFHFIRAFTAEFHVTPHQYLQARRAARAKSLLAQRATPAQYQHQIGTRPMV